MKENLETADGIERNSLESLTHEQEEIVLTLMARIMERAYRRGLQQGVVWADQIDDCIPDLEGWRYENCLDKAPDLHGHLREGGSLYRLKIEEREQLKKIGLWKNY